MRLTVAYTNASLLQASYHWLGMAGVIYCSTVQEQLIRLKYDRIRLTFDFKYFLVHVDTKGTI